jgi:glycosyltransferase involved in cell wall biosynthesis/CDP-glycerol glycerophosphotransferase (TagB/SpsB family)
MPAPPSQTHSTMQRAFGLARKRVSGRLKRGIRRVAGRPLVAWERRVLRPVLSVVIPVYNVEAYLRECLDTVLTQSLRDLEVIAVDDGSTDGCLDILREFERRDARVRVLTQSNSGQGIARNLGVEHAQGEFLAFVDSDDTIPPGSFEHMVDTLRRSGSDFCVGSVRRLRHGQYLRTSWQRTVHRADRIGTTLENFPAAMQDIICANRMFRTAFWRDRVGGFRGHTAYEDHVPMLTAYVRARQFDILSRVTYNWRIREDLTSTGQQKAEIANLLDRLAVKDEAHEFLVAEASEFVYDVWVARCLEVDLPPYAARGLDADESYRNVLRDAYRTFCDRATERAWDLVRVFPKVRGHLVAESRWDDAEDATDYFLSVHQVPPTHVVGERLVADLPGDRPFTEGLPEHLLRMAPLEAHFEGVVQKVAWRDDRVTLAGWMRHRSLDLSEPPLLQLSLHGAEKVHALELEQVVVPEANLWAQLPYAGCELGGFRVTIPFELLTHGSWQLRGSVSAHGITSSGAFHDRIPGSSGAHPGLAAGIEADWDPGEGFVLRCVRRSAATPVRSRLAVDRVELGNGEVRLRMSGLAASPVRDVSLSSARSELALVDASAVGEEHLLRFAATAREFAGPLRPAPSGDYELTVEHRAATVADDLSGELPLRLRDADLDIEIGIGRDRALQLSVVPPLHDDELGRYHQVRLQTAYRRAAPALTDTIVLTSSSGDACTASPRAVDRDLAAARPDLERLWGVRDRSVVVPEGARPVLLDSAEWYDAVASARYLCSSVGLGPWLRLRPGQAYLQTFGGHPFESMGRALWRSKGLPPGRVRHLARGTSGEWDLILVPTENAATWYREQYGYTGAVLAVGYPHTDTLINADRVGVRRDVLARLGVPEDRRVVLHAPADRDVPTTDPRTGRPYAGLDLAQLSGLLGPQYVVLVRGSHQHALDRPRRGAAVVDVTHYPEVNDLVLAADVAVLDYSSLRFDWALTGKPMVFFVPDLESYLARRPPLFPFEQSAPGPWVRTTRELAGQLIDLEGVRASYSDQVAAFNERYNALNDGHATKRVLTSFLDESMPWRPS